MQRQPGLYIAVVGAAEATASQIEDALTVGRLLAESGAVVVCGGLGGVMHAAARGCESAGGTSIGILPGDDRGPGSPHLTVVIATGLGEARNALVTRTVDAVIAIGGEWGTLSEIALASKMGKPVVGLHSWAPSRRGITDPITHVETPSEAVDVAIRRARQS